MFEVGGECPARFDYCATPLQAEEHRQKVATLRRWASDAWFRCGNLDGGQ